MPDYGFYNLDALPSWVQYLLASKSLLRAVDVDDPEQTVMLQMTISELSLMSFALLVTSRLFPEFLGLSCNLSDKVHAVSDAQGFLKSE